MTQKQIIPIWPGDPTGSTEQCGQQQDFVFEQPRPHRIRRNISTPTLTVFLPEPDTATGSGVIVCPGGAYHVLAIDHEGYEVARWLVRRGIAAFVLEYRVIATPHDDAEFLALWQNLDQGGRLRRVIGEHWPLALADGQQALRLVRQCAREWGLCSDSIGILGFSAGGHLATGTALYYDAASRPAFVASIYGALWQVAAIPADAPPLFALVAGDDSVSLTSCLAMYTAWHEAGRSAELHVYAQGAHGFGMLKQGLPIDNWIERCGDWLQQQTPQSASGRAS